MTKHGIYTIYNKVEGVYSPLDIASNDIIAIRRFKSALNSDKVIYKSDFELYKVGEIDITTFELLPATKTLISTYADLENNPDVE